MTDKDLIAKLANVPLAKPGFDALGMSAPVLVQMNPQGKWENCKPGNMDEERLKAVVQHLVSSKAVSAAQSYCCQCASESQKEGGKSNYVPVVMMPILPADQCPFDLDCEFKKSKESDEKKPAKKTTAKEAEKDSEKEKDKKKIKKRSFVLQRPLAKPGFDALGMSAPVLVQMNPQGKWENCKPGNMDEERLKAVVQHLVSSKAVSAAQSYCCQCASESQKEGGKSNYVPVVMMPILPADQCPFDLDCEFKKSKESDEKKPAKKTTAKEAEKDSEKEKDKKKIKKRSFVLQRLTDFDLLSQW